MNGPIIKKLELHCNPENKSQWAVSFIYDVDGEDGDIIYDGDIYTMTALYNKYERILVGVEYFAALQMMKL